MWLQQILNKGGGGGGGGGGGLDWVDVKLISSLINLIE